MKGNLSLKTARIISTLFVPPSITLLAFTYFTFRFEVNIINRFIVLGTVLVFGFILPIIMFIRLRKQGRIVDIDATDKNERIYPFLIGILFYLTGYIVLNIAGINPLIQSFWFCYITNTLIIVLITKYWKISIHTLGAAGPLAALTYVLGYYALPFFVLLIIIGWARLRLNVHTFNQVTAGAVLGFLFTYIQIILILRSRNVP